MTYQQPPGALNPYGPQQPQGPAQAPNPYGQPHGIPQNTQAPPGTQPPPQQPQGPAAIYMPSAEVVQAGIARAQEIQKAIQNGGSGKKKFFDVLGPNGQPWKTAYPGFVGKRAIYFAPSWKEHGPVFVERVKRFWKSANHPQGRSIYAGDDSLVAKAVSLAYQQGFNKDGMFLKRNRQFIWQGFAIEVDPNTQQLFANPGAHVNEQGELKPVLFQASLTLHNSILQEINVVGQGDDAAGFYKCLHPNEGRPFLVVKTKTGPESRNVEYKISRLEPMPLPQEYHLGLHKLWPLEDLFQEATPQEQIAAIIDAGLPVPPEAQQYMGQVQGQQGAMQAPPPPPPSQFMQPQNVQGAGYGAPYQQPQYPTQQVPGYQSIPQGMPQVSYQALAAPPAPSPFPPGQSVGQVPGQAPAQPIPLPHAPPTGAAAAAPPPMPQGPPPPPTGAPVQVTQSAPPVPAQPPPPTQQVPAQGTPAQQPGAMTPEQLQAQFQGGKPQF